MNPAGPENLYVETANHCILKCATCPLQAYASLEPPHTLSVREFRSILEQVPTAKRVVLHGVGEPLVNPHLEEIVALAKTAGLEALFNTNAILLDAGRAAALLDAGLDELRVSIDAADPETYRSVRPGGEFSTVVANVSTFLEERRKRGGPRPKVSFWMTAARSRISSLPDLVRLAARVGVDEVYLQRLVWRRPPDDAGRWSSSQAVDDESIFGRGDAAVLAALDEAARVAADQGVPLWGAGDADPTRRPAADGHPQPWRRCHRPFSTTYITARGNILPCCIVPMAEPEALTDRFLGNVFERPFPEHWEGGRYRLFREAFLSAEPWPVCRRCGTDWSL